MSIEKYLLFLIPRELTKRRVVHMLDSLCSRRGRVYLSAFYVDTALGLCQYQLKPARADSDAVSGHKAHTCLSLAGVAVSPQKMCFPSFKSRGDRGLQALFVAAQGSSPTSKERELAKLIKAQPWVFQNLSQDANGRRAISCRSKCPTLYLYCASVLGSPDMQDIAQSGLMTLEGSLTLELSIDASV